MCGGLLSVLIVFVGNKWVKVFLKSVVVWIFKGVLSEVIERVFMILVLVL